MRDEQDKNELIIYGELFYQMLQRPWFQEIVETRFDIQKNIDEEEKRIDLIVIEVPMEVTMKRLSDKEKKRQEAAPKIVTPTNKELVTFNKKNA